MPEEKFYFKKIDMPKKSTMLKKDFFARDSETVAKDLLGRVFVRERPEKTKLYVRLEQIASWEGNSKSMAKQTAYAPGTIFVLPKFGKNVFGIATEDIGVYSCVTLISGSVFDEKGFREYVDGPGNLSSVLEIDKEYDGVPIDFSDSWGRLWIGGEPVEQNKIMKRVNPRLPKSCKGYFYYKPLDILIS